MATSLTLQVSKWQVGIFGTAVFCYWVALYLYVPTLPVYVQGFSHDLGHVGIVLSMYGLWQALTRFPLGLVSDWLGRSRPFILIGFGLTALGAWMLGSASSIVWLGAARSVTGLAAATWVPIVVVFCRFFPPQQTIRATAILVMVGAVGRILATSVTGFLNDIGGYALAFQLAAGIALLAMALTWLVREEPRALRRPALGPVGAMVRRPPVLYPALLNAMAQFVNFGVTFGFLPILATQLGASDVQLSLLITVNFLFNLVGNTTTATIAHRLGARNLIRTEFVCMGLGALVAGLAPQLWWLFLAQACIGLAAGVGYPTLLGLSIRDVSDHERTAAMGLHQAVYGFGMFGGPFVAGFLADRFGISVTFVAMAVLCLLLLVPRLSGRLLLVATEEPVPAPSG